MIILYKIILSWSRYQSAAMGTENSACLEIQNQGDIFNH